MEYTGDLINQNEANIREKKYRAANIDIYLFELATKKGIIDATMFGNLGRFVNHSCIPNCVAYGNEEGDGIHIFALIDVAMDTELTLDDGRDIPWNCGQVGCRKIIGRKRK